MWMDSITVVCNNKSSLFYVIYVMTFV